MTATIAGVGQPARPITSPDHPEICGDAGVDPGVLIPFRLRGVCGWGVTRRPRPSHGSTNLVAVSAYAPPEIVSKSHQTAGKLP